MNVQLHPSARIYWDLCSSCWEAKAWGPAPSLTLKQCQTDQALHTITPHKWGIILAVTSRHFTPFAMVRDEAAPRLGVFSGRCTRLKASAMDTDAHTDITAETPACTDHTRQLSY